MNDTDAILSALFHLRDSTRLTVAECDQVVAALVARTPPFDGVRTLGDLKVVLERGGVEAKLAKKLKQVLD
jgi:hypothetical protein